MKDQTVSLLSRASVRRAVRRFGSLRAALNARRARKLKRDKHDRREQSEKRRA
jgi:hypothetical protein